MDAFHRQNFAVLEDVTRRGRTAACPPGAGRYESRRPI